LPHLLRNGQPVHVDLSAAELNKDGIVWVSFAACRKPGLNSELCQPARFIAQPSIAYRLARVAAGDGVCAVSLVPLSAHDVAAVHHFVRGVWGGLLTQGGLAVSYGSDGMDHMSGRCFGGAVSSCAGLALRPRGRVFAETCEIRLPGGQEARFPTV